MQKGLIAREGVIIGLIERTEDATRKPYVFTYDPSFNECYQLDDLDIRDKPHYLMHIPFIMISHFAKINRSVLDSVRDRPDMIDDLSLWLKCCDLGLIPEEDGCRVIYH